MITDLSQPFRPLSFQISQNNVKEAFKKWGVSKVTIKRFSYEFTKFQDLEADSFFQKFFRDEGVQSAFPVAKDIADALKVKYEKISCSITNMDFFDSLTNTGIVRSTGLIARCELDIIDDFDITDKLRKALVVEDSEEFQKLERNIEKKEFIFQLFQMLVLGGQLNQYEDTIEPYIQITKLFYKDLVRAVKNPISKKIHVVSKVFRLESIEIPKRSGIFSSKLPHNNLFLIIDETSKYITLLYFDY